MSLSPVKQEILETMLLYEKPMRAMEIAKETKKEFPQVMMHLLGLVKMGYVSTPEKGQYLITVKGKQALGVPEINKEIAIAIIAYAPHDKAFEFYVDIGKPSICMLTVFETSQTNLKKQTSLQPSSI